MGQDVIGILLSIVLAVLVSFAPLAIVVYFFHSKQDNDNNDEPTN